MIPVIESGLCDLITSQGGPEPARVLHKHHVSQFKGTGLGMLVMILLLYRLFYLNLILEVRLYQI